MYYKLVRATKPSELKRCSKYRRNHTKRCTINHLQRKKSNHLHDLLHIYMNENTLVDTVSSFASTSLCIFFFFLLFTFLSSKPLWNS